ncbi:hypothetical protein PybrP1_009557 [[Pythium] brassicae (nom. inval.)]|nr:hypothetical protein PybrP1_009557 [[Pythium] brassicae (nom. inval.)]
MRFDYADAAGRPDVHMARPPSASDLSAAASATLTYSASCPSFTALYELSSDDDLIREIQAGGLPQQQHHQLLLPSAHEHTLAPHFASDKSYDFVLQMQHEHLDASLRQFPHQQAHFHGDLDHFALFNQPRRPLHASASFTSLSSMETEYRRGQSATKRKKAGGERWHKMQRHKSFDSTTTSPATSMEFSAYSGSSQFESTPEHNFLDEVPDTDMIGFSIDDFPSTFTSDASWPMPLTLGGGIPFDAYAVDDGASSVVSGDAASATDLLGIVSAEAESKRGAADPTAADDAPQTSADIDLLLSDHERANMSSLFDAIREFEAPPALDATPPPVAAAAVAPPAAVAAKKPKEKRAPAAKRRTHSPPLHPSQPRAIATSKRNARSKSFSLPKRVDASAPPLPSLRDRLQQLLLNARDVDERTALLEAERAFLASSPLFLPAKASETAGSLWLILHAARRCEFGCEIAGCHVMRRVVKHCLGCDVALGECKDPCNEAKAMMLHFGSCAKAACVVCHKMRGIDQAHHASTQVPIVPPTLATPILSAPVAAPMSAPAAAPMSFLSIPRVPIAPQPKPTTTSLSTSVAGCRPLASAASKPVAIQPNPLPTASNPLGLVGVSFPHFGYALSLYLEQTSATFRAEVKARVEKRVTAAAGQDLIQHMQKKTRLRSLDDLRADARTLVLGELERELHLHMQAYTWAANNQGSGDAPPQLGGHDCMLPPYLLSVAAAGFATFYAQQASLHAALSELSAPALSPLSSAPAPSLSRRKPSISSGAGGSSGASGNQQPKSRAAPTGAAQKADAALAAT